MRNFLKYLLNIRIMAVYIFISFHFALILFSFLQDRLDEAVQQEMKRRREEEKGVLVKREKVFIKCLLFPFFQLRSFCHKMGSCQNHLCIQEKNIIEQEQVFEFQIFIQNIQFLLDCRKYRHIQETVHMKSLSLEINNILFIQMFIKNSFFFVFKVLQSIIIGEICGY